MSGAILVTATAAARSLTPLGMYWFKCSRCGQTFKGVGGE